MDWKATFDSLLYAVRMVSVQNICSGPVDPPPGERSSLTCGGSGSAGGGRRSEAAASRPLVSGVHAAGGRLIPVQRKRNMLMFHRHPAPPCRGPHRPDRRLSQRTHQTERSHQPGPFLPGFLFGKIPRLMAPLNEEARCTGERSFAWRYHPVLK